MKPFTNRLATLGTSLLFPLYMLWKRCKKGTVVFILITAFVLSSCFQHYFRARTQQRIDAATMKTLQYSNKYFIVHYSDKVSGLFNVSLSSDSLKAELVELPPEHKKFLDVNDNNVNRVKKADKTAVLMEVHLYYPQPMPAGKTDVSIPLAGLNKIDVFEFDKNATTVNHVLSWIGAGAVAVVAAGLIAFAIACNCPQVYVNTDGQYEFKGGVYSGAVYSSLERSDYLSLEGLQPVNGKYQFRIGNVVNEEQFINQVQLLKVEHAADVKVLADRHGKVLSYKEPALPVKAMYDESIDVTRELQYADDLYYSFDSRANANGFSSVVISFNKPSDARSARLLVHAGNSKWSGYLYKEFASMFGSGYEKWRDQQEKAPSANASQWQIDQGLPLRVFAETDNGWQYADHFALTGNTSSRDMIMELDLTNVKTDKVNIRLETVFQFWNINKVAMDFSDNAVLNTSLVNPALVTKEDGTIHTNEILQQDQNYLHLTGKEVVNIEFDAIARDNGNVTSMFLASSGYYHSLYKSDNKPDLQSLMKFKKDGAFDSFSRTKYATLMETFANATVKLPVNKR
jgi:hypothetical protein